MRNFFERLLMFIPDDGAGAGGGGVVTPVVEPVVPITTPAPGKVDDTTPKYTDRQLNDLIAKNVGSELKKAGVDNIKELAELIAKAKNPAPADDPVKAELEGLKKTTGELSTRADKNEAMALALKSGVTDEKKLERVVKLALSPAYEGSIAERISAIVTESPEFVSVAAPVFGVQSKNDSPDVVATILDKVRQQAGLAIPAPVVKK